MFFFLIAVKHLAFHMLTGNQFLKERPTCFPAQQIFIIIFIEIYSSQVNKKYEYKSNFRTIFLLDFFFFYYNSFQFLGNVMVVNNGSEFFYF